MCALPPQGSPPREPFSFAGCRPAKVSPIGDEITSWSNGAVWVGGPNPLMTEPEFDVWWEDFGEAFIRRKLRRVLRRAEDVEDCLTETYLRSRTKLDQYNERSSRVGRWVSWVMFGVLRDLLRDVRRQRKIVPTEPVFADVSMLLTARDVRAVRMLARGAAPPYIAKKLGLSEDRCRQVLSRLYKRLGVRNALGAVKVCFRVGIVTVKDLLR